MAETTVQQDSLSSDELAAQVQAIYERTFSPEELVPFAELRTSIREGGRLLYVARAGTQALGFATLVPVHARPDIYLLEYLAVERAARNGGIGSRLLAAIATGLAGRGVAGFVIEIKPPEPDFATPPTMNQRRLGFYRRNGADLVLKAPGYRMPNLVGPGSMPLRLLWRPLDERYPELSGDLLRECIAGIFSASYSRPTGDPLLQSILSTVS
jgi:GNAT superfamily N-acetyltransferase